MLTATELMTPIVTITDGHEHSHTSESFSVLTAAPPPHPVRLRLSCDVNVSYTETPHGAVHRITGTIFNNVGPGATTISSTCPLGDSAGCKAITLGGPKILIGRLVTFTYPSYPWEEVQTSRNYALTLPVLTFVPNDLPPGAVSLVVTTSTTCNHHPTFDTNTALRAGGIATTQWRYSVAPHVTLKVPSVIDFGESNFGDSPVERPFEMNISSNVETSVEVSITAPHRDKSKGLIGPGVFDITVPEVGIPTNPTLYPLDGTWVRLGTIKPGGPIDRGSSMRLYPPATSSPPQKFITPMNITIRAI